MQHDCGSTKADAIGPMRLRYPSTSPSRGRDKKGLVQYPSRHPVGAPPVVAIQIRGGHPCGGRGMDEFAVADIDAHMAGV